MKYGEDKFDLEMRELTLSSKQEENLKEQEKIQKDQLKKFYLNGKGYSLLHYIIQSYMDRRSFPLATPDQEELIRNAEELVKENPQLLLSTDIEGKTPLHLAASDPTGFCFFIPFMDKFVEDKNLQQQVIHLKDNDGKTVLDWLLEYMIDPTGSFRELALNNKLEELIVYFIKNGVRLYLYRDGVRFLNTVAKCELQLIIDVIVEYQFNDFVFLSESNVYSKEIFKLDDKIKLAFENKKKKFEEIFDNITTKDRTYLWNLLEVVNKNPVILTFNGKNARTLLHQLAIHGRFYLLVLFLHLMESNKLLVSKLINRKDFCEKTFLDYFYENRLLFRNQYESFDSFFDGQPYANQIGIPSDINGCLDWLETFLVAHGAMKGGKALKFRFLKEVEKKQGETQELKIFDEMKEKICDSEGTPTQVSVSDEEIISLFEKSITKHDLLNLLTLLDEERRTLLHYIGRHGRVKTFSYIAKIGLSAETLDLFNVIDIWQSKPLDYLLVQEMHVNPTQAFDKSKLETFLNELLMHGVKVTLDNNLFQVLKDMLDREYSEGIVQLILNTQKTELFNEDLTGKSVINNYLEKIPSELKQEKQTKKGIAKIKAQLRSKEEFSFFTNLWRKPDKEEKLIIPVLEKMLQELVRKEQPQSVKVEEIDAEWSLMGADETVTQNLKPEKGFGQS